MELHLKPIRLGTRPSPLALTQARLVSALLTRAHRGLSVELVEISTRGDELTGRTLRSFGGTGVFVKELENALLKGTVDLAVHSLKDLPTRQPQGLVLAAISGREDTRDVAIVRGQVRLEDLPARSVLGTGSLRRRAQLKRRYPHLEFGEIRGNVQTRIRKVQEGEYSGIILARAGIRRLGLLDEVTQVLPLSVVLPAPGQGALGLECRASDRRVRRLVGVLNQPDLAACVAAERACLEALGGGCHLPLGALARPGPNGTLRLRAILGLPDGSREVRAVLEGPLSQARRLGRRAAQTLLAGGGQEVLAELEKG